MFMEHSLWILARTMGEVSIESRRRFAPWTQRLSTVLAVRLLNRTPAPSTSYLSSNPATIHGNCNRISDEGPGLRERLLPDPQERLPHLSPASVRP